MSLANYNLTDQDVRTVSGVKGGEKLGQVASTADGRTFAYGLNGSGSGTALSPGKLAQGALSAANHVNRTGVTYSAGATQMVFAVGATAVTANQYEDGYFYVNAGTGLGQSLLIANHSTAASSGTVTVNLKDALIAATSSTDSKFSLQPNAYSACIISAHASATAIFATGVPNVSIPDTDYGWFQVGGPCAVLANGTPAVGGALIPSATTDGAVDVDGTSSVQPKVGYCMITAVSTEYRMVNLTINPR
jgi:hypothetical protein